MSCPKNCSSPGELTENEMWECCPLGVTATRWRTSTAAELCVKCFVHSVRVCSALSHCHTSQTCVLGSTRNTSSLHFKMHEWTRSLQPPHGAAVSRADRDDTGKKIPRGAERLRGKQARSAIYWPTAEKHVCAWSARKMEFFWVFWTQNKTPEEQQNK